MSAVIATSAAALISGGIAVAGAVQQNKSAKKQQQAIDSNKEGLYGKKVDAPELAPFDPTSGAKDLYSSLPFLNQVATYNTKVNQKNREVVAGGNFQSNPAKPILSAVPE